MAGMMSFHSSHFLDWFVIQKSLVQPKASLDGSSRPFCVIFRFLVLTQVCSKMQIRDFQIILKHHTDVCVCSNQQHFTDPCHPKKYAKQVSSFRNISSFTQRKQDFWSVTHLDEHSLLAGGVVLHWKCYQTFTSTIHRGGSGALITYVVKAFILLIVVIYISVTFHRGNSQFARTCLLLR